MRALSGTRWNFFFIYHLPANLLLSIVYCIWLLPLTFHNPRHMSPLEIALLFYGVLNVVFLVIIYTPFYMNRISVLYLHDDRFRIDGHLYDPGRLQSITRFTGNYPRNRQVYYQLKIGHAGDYRVYKVAERACWKALNPLHLFGIRQHRHLVEELRRLGLRNNVREADLPLWPGRAH